MAVKKTPPAAAGLARGVLAANVYIHNRDESGELTGSGTWYGPSHTRDEKGRPRADGGQPPPALAATLPESVWDVRANWPTPDDAERAGLDWYGGPDLDRANGDDPTEV